MQLSEITSFLNPFGETLSTIFVLTLIILSIITVVWLFISANEENWEENWHGGDLEDDSNNLASEHGSVHELSEAVATKAEKVAEIMPSMLLIVGLLGTFLGLGIALNKASTVLAMADTSGMDSAMTQLMGLMDGLGAKFKTSTWGILCFILLNVLFNMFGFKEKRLAWAIRQSREEIDRQKQLRAVKENQKQQDLINILKTIDSNAQQQNKHLIDSLQSLYKTNINSQKSLFATMAKVLTTQHESTQQNLDTHLNKVVDSINQNNQSLIEITTQSAKDNLIELQKIADYNQSTQESMQNFVEQTVDSMASVGVSADKMAESAQAVGNSAEGLNNVVENLRNELENVMSMIKQDLGETINNMGDSFEENMVTMTNSMSNATQGISKAVDELSTSVDNTMTEVTRVIGESMDLQRKSANEFTVTSETLNTQIFEMTNLVQQLSGDITSGLKAVSESGRRMTNLDKRYAKYSDMIEEITNRNDELVNNINQLSSSNQKLINNVENLLTGIEHSTKAISQTNQSSSELVEKVSAVFMQNSNQLDTVRQELLSKLDDLSKKNHD